MTQTEHPALPEHLRRELFAGPDDAAPRATSRTALLGALIVVLTAGGAVWITGLSVPWPQ